MYSCNCFALLDYGYIYNIKKSNDIKPILKISLWYEDNTKSEDIKVKNSVQ